MHDTLIRQLAAVRAAAQPALASRCDKAVALVLTGKVHLAGPTQALVDSYREPGVQYAVNGTCACPDAKHGAPDGWCAHKIACDLLRACPPPSSALSAEAAFSITLRGFMGGHDAMLTARGATWEEFSTNVARLKGLLDAGPGRQPGEEDAPVEGPRVCPRHGITLKPSTFEAGTLFCPKRNEDGKYCTERWPAKGQPR
jgi:hypothetical protein